MENERLHNDYRSELKRRGLPRAYIERLLAELDDHYTDLLEERSTSMGAARKLQSGSDDIGQRLGDPTHLAIFAAEQYHARSFWGRHPLVTFVLAPLPLLVAMMIGYGLVIWIAVLGMAYMGSWVIDWNNIKSYDHPWLQAILLTLVTWGVLVVPPFMSALVLCRVYRRNAVHLRWPVLGCALLAIVAAAFTFSWRLSTGPSEAERGLFMFGLFAASSMRWIAAPFLLKFALAFGIGLLLIKRAQMQMELEA